MFSPAKKWQKSLSGVRRLSEARDAKRRRPAAASIRSKHLRRFPSSAATATSFPAAAGRSRRLTAHQLVEVAALATSSFILHQQGKPALFKLVEPIIPFNAFQRTRSGVTREIQPDHAHIFAAACALHAGRRSLAFLRPLLDLIALGQDSAVRRRPTSRHGAYIVARRRTT